MTLRNNPEIGCDWPGCYIHSSDLKVYRAKAAEIRAVLAEEHGWSQRVGQDFCGHHPELPDHVPTVKKVTEGWTTGHRASCSCGWVDDRNPWPGNRSTTVFWWVQHLPKEDGAACSKLLWEAKKAVEEEL